VGNISITPGKQILRFPYEVDFKDIFWSNEPPKLINASRPDRFVTLTMIRSYNDRGIQLLSNSQRVETYFPELERDYTLPNNIARDYVGLSGVQVFYRESAKKIFLVQMTGSADNLKTTVFFGNPQSLNRIKVNRVSVYDPKMDSEQPHSERILIETDLFSIILPKIADISTAIQLVGPPTENKPRHAEPLVRIRLEDPSSLQILPSDSTNIVRYINTALSDTSCRILNGDRYH